MANELYIGSNTLKIKQIFYSKNRTNNVLDLLEIEAIYYSSPDPDSIVGNCETKLLWHRDDDVILITEPYNNQGKELKQYNMCTDNDPYFVSSVLKAKTYNIATETASTRLFSKANFELQLLTNGYLTTFKSKLTSYKIKKEYDASTTIVENSHLYNICKKILQNEFTDSLISYKKAKIALIFSDSQIK